MKKLIFIIALFTLVGCGNAMPEVTPDNLPPATYGKPYHAVINISGGYMYENNISIKITPADSGLMWSPEITYLTFQGEKQKNVNYHTISISGTVLTREPIKIDINGSSFGTVYAGKEFKKIYKLAVNE